jgi:hypothetical protein
LESAPLGIAGYAFWTMIRQDGIGWFSWLRSMSVGEKNYYGRNKAQSNNSHADPLHYAYMSKIPSESSSLSDKALPMVSHLRAPGDGEISPRIHQRRRLIDRETAVGFRKKLYDKMAPPRCFKTDRNADAVWSRPHAEILDIAPSEPALVKTIGIFKACSVETKKGGLW